MTDEQGNGTTWNAREETVEMSNINRKLMAGRPKSQEAEWNYWEIFKYTYAVYIPGINIIVNTRAHAEPPSFDDLEKTLNTLAIVCALILACTFGMTGMVDYDELEAADARYYAYPDFAWFVDGFASYGMVGSPPSAIFAKWVSTANCMMLLSLMSLVVIYIYLVNGVEEGSAIEAYQCEVWWNHGGAVLIGVMIAIMFTGLVDAFYGLNVLAWIKYPDSVVYSEKYERSASDASNWKSPLNSLTAMSVYGMTIPFIVAVVLTSVLHTITALKSKNITRLKEYHHERLKILIDEYELLENVLQKIGNDAAGAEAIRHAMEQVKKDLDAQARIT